MTNSRSIDALYAALVTAAFILITTLLMKLGEVFNLRQMIAGAALTIFIFSIITALVLTINKSQREIRLETVIARLKSLSAKSYPWLYDDDELAEVESNTEGRSVWIVSPDLKNVTEKENIIRAVKRNIEKGIAYTYILPDTPKVRARLQRLETVFGSHRHLLKRRLMEENDFRKLAVGHIAIFNIDSSTMSPREAFIELPISEPGYWIKVEKEAGEDLAGRFEAEAMKAK